MLKLNYIRVIIPQQFDFDMYGIDTKEDRDEFLQRMCDGAINSPIIKANKAIGVITDSKITKNGKGLLLGGNIWCDVGYQILKTNSGYDFSAVVVSERETPYVR